MVIILLVAWGRDIACCLDLGAVFLDNIPTVLIFQRGPKWQHQRLYFQHPEAPSLGLFVILSLQPCHRNSDPIFCITATFSVSRIFPERIIQPENKFEADDWTIMWRLVKTKTWSWTQPLQISFVLITWARPDERNPGNPKIWSPCGVIAFCRPYVVESWFPECDFASLPPQTRAKLTLLVQEFRMRLWNVAGFWGLAPFLKLNIHSIF